ncbi:hypothetical protein [Mesorhizobium huakuii]|uniref:Lipoprotein n=1 Tax=Mesorhizobium huakuii TaxID=28104 RepID=A0A7G6T6D9_9HYPH|nr:hypothetical protein [Mesorhizobium huakuii]QND62321.1 hypothetical protein HB778_40685 [Mesorhizobium huakuii]
MSPSAFLPFWIALVLAGCAQPVATPVVDATLLPATEPLYRPEWIQPGRLEYAPDRSTFAPVLTERFAYPTQPQANDAYRRLVVLTPSASRPYPASIWLFGCKPGALDAQTARVTRYRGPVVHCATDFLDPSGRRVSRETVNFYYYRSAWNMQPVYPPVTAVPWRTGEHSPKDRWWWVPGRSRYE